MSFYIRYLYNTFTIPRGIKLMFKLVSPHEVSPDNDIIVEAPEDQASKLSRPFKDRAVGKDTLFLAPYY